MRGISVDVHPFLAPQAYLRRPLRAPPFPLDQPGCRLYRRARHGLWWGFERLGLGAGDEVLAPAYHHGSEIETLARAGLGLRFYEATESLAPDEAELEALLGPRVRALHLIHYLGFPQDAPHWRAWCDERGLLLIEDAAQSWLSSVAGRPVGSFGDLAFFSLYKTIALGDGAVALAPQAELPINATRGLEAKEVGRHVRRWLAQYAPAVSGARLGVGAAKEYDPDEDFDLGDPGAPVARTTRPLLRRARPAEVTDRRRANYIRLLVELRERVPPPFDVMSEGACPMYLPIYAEDKHKAITRLAEHGVRGLDLWLVPHPSLPVEEFPGARWRRRTTLGLPVHQGVTPEQLDQIIRAANYATGEPPHPWPRLRG